MIYHDNDNTMRKGFTLVETIIAVGLFTVIVLIAIGGFTNALRAQRQVSALISAQSNISLVLEQMAREMRTGYLFCTSSNSAVPNPACGCSPVIGDSGYKWVPTPPPLVGDTIGATGDLPVWSCSALSYYTQDSSLVTYSVDPQTHALMKSDMSAATTSPQAITGNTIMVKNLKFILFGNVEGDTWTPRITVAMSIAPSSTNNDLANDLLNLQTTVSARTIDCTTLGGTTQC